MTIKVTIDEWRAEWEGGRLADIFHVTNPDYPLDCTQVGPYDWQKGRLESDITRADIRSALREWIQSNGDDYSRELPYL